MNISRSHDWEKGNFSETINIFVENNLKEPINADEIGKNLFEEFKTTIYYGALDKETKDEKGFSAKVEKTFYQKQSLSNHKNAPATMTNDYLESVKKQFKYYKLLGDKTFAQLADDKLFWQYNDDSNSIATIVKHIWGNMLSRWTDFLTSDGEKTWRDRDAEFENDISSRQELLAKWEEGWDCVFKALEPLTANDLNKIIYIRNQEHTVIDAISRQLAHYAYHIGQIVYLGKMLAEKGWTSLTIPKGQSKAFNSEKFSRPKQKGHFADEFLKDTEA